MNTLIRLLVRILPSSILESLQDEGLKELDRRGLIIWANDLNQEEK